MAQHDRSFVHSGRDKHVSSRLRAGTHSLDPMQPATRKGTLAKRPWRHTESPRAEASAADCALRLVMPARAENVPVIRHALTGVATALRLDARTVDNLRLAITEACTNVVRHAYDGAAGTLEVRVRSTPEAVTVDVRDFGAGMRPRRGSSSLGLGLPLIAGVCDGLRIARDADDANVVTMTFLRSPQRPRPHLVGG